MDRSYRALIVGCGAIAGGYDAARPDDAGPLTHAAAYRRHGGFRLAGCVEPDAARREAFTRRWQVEAGYADMDAARAGGPYDVISICSPTALHAAHLEAALALGPRLIFCEKPVTVDLGQTRKFVDGCKSAGVLLAVNHTRRWSPAIAAVKDEIATGKWGVVRAAHGVYNKGVLNNGSHMIDLLHLLLGPLRLEAAGPPVWDFWDDDPTVPAVLSAVSGATVTLGVAHAADYTLFELTIVAEKGVLTMEDGGGHWRLRHSVDSDTFPGYRVLDQGEWRAGDHDRAMLAAVTEIHAAMARGAPLASTGDSALEAQSLCAAIRDAALAKGQ